MAIQFFDVDHVLITDFHAYLDGKSGGTFEFPIFIKNDDADYIYANLELRYVVDSNPDWMTDLDTLATDGWFVKMYEGQRPTESAWISMPPRSRLSLSDIGDQLAPSSDIVTYKEVWIRLYCPGNTRAKLHRDHQLKIVGKQIPV